MNKDVLEEVNSRKPFVCERWLLLHDHQCMGRITREHALIYAGRQIDEAWAIALLCELAHSVGPYMDTGILDKRINEWIVVNRMGKREMRRYPRVDWEQKKRYLNGLFGVPKMPTGQSS